MCMGHVGGDPDHPILTPSNQCYSHAKVFCDLQSTHMVALAQTQTTD